MKINYELVFGMDKVGHFLLFFVVSFILGLVCLVVINKYHVRKSLGIVWLYLILLGLFEEYRQYFLPERSAEFLDAIANLLGTTTGLGIPFLLSSLLVKKKGQPSPQFNVIFYIFPIPFLIGLWLINERPFF
ncbi:VanZ family protein [Fredinandcohnia sp. 179-A 10B2 NHS]|uniref:VanZ family protein n=1 Tax=Fredinandcohnia sp. 179-A 10B2 NHS TaxID=3235176 RepID=UPI0039A1036A